MVHRTVTAETILNRIQRKTIFFLCAIFIAWVPSVQAVNLEACRRYASEAVRQNEQNKMLNAGFSGPAWSSDFDAHFNWCKHGNNLASTPVHLALREKALQEFAIKTGSDAAKRYATESVRQNQESQFMGANFPPPVWSDNFSQHYNWSRQGNNLATTPDHLANREKALQEYAIKYNKGPRMQMMTPVKAKEIVGTVIKPGQPKTGTITGKAVVPDLAKIAALTAQKKQPVMMRRTDMLRQNIARQPGNKFTVTPTTAFSIPKGKLETRILFDVPEPGLYKIHINLAPSQPYCSISPRVDQETQVIKLQQAGPLQQAQTIFDTPVAEKTSGGGFMPWIISNDDLSSQYPRPADYYIWIDKNHLPVNGKLQLRFEVTGVQKNMVSGSTGEIGESGFIAAAQTALKDHAPVVGNISVDHVIPHTVSFEEQFDINGSKVPYSIVTLPSAIKSGSAFSVIQTPVINLNSAGTTDVYQSPTVSFFLANAEQLSSKTPPADATPQNGLSVSKTPRPNEWIYKEILSREYGMGQSCDAVSKNGVSVCAKQKRISYYAWDTVPSGFNGSYLYDVKVDGPGFYATIVSNNPIDSRLTSTEQFSTTGVLFVSGQLPGDQLRNEILVATRYSEPMKWTYVAELAKLSVSEQAETDDDDNDEEFGEFSVLTTSILTEPIGEEQLSVAKNQIVNHSMPYPIVDNEDRPHNFSLRPQGNPGGNPAGNAPAKNYPKVPIFVMDEQQMEKYDSLVMNVIMTEHDEMTFWQENGNVIKAFGQFCMKIGGMVKSGFDAVGLAKSLYEFAKTDLNPSSNVDDFMGNAAISVFKNDRFGLLDNNRVVFELTGPADPNCFDMAYNAGNKGRASVSSSAVGCGNARHVSAVIKIRRVPQLNSWADIQLLSYVPLVDPQYELLDDFKKKLLKNHKRDQHLTEGILSNAHSSWNLTDFKDVKAGQKIVVRNAKMPASPADLNKSVIQANEFNRGQLTLNSQRWQGKGFTYYQALLEDVSFGRFPAANISFTLYHEDVIKYEGEKSIRWLDLDGSNGTLGIISRKVPGTNCYRVDIRLIDTGDWVESVDLVAWVYINQ